MRPRKKRKTVIRAEKSLPQSIWGGPKKKRGGKKELEKGIEGKTTGKQKDFQHAWQKLQGEYQELRYHNGLGAKVEKKTAWPHASSGKPNESCEDKNHHDKHIKGKDHGKIRVQTYTWLSCPATALEWSTVLFRGNKKKFRSDQERKENPPIAPSSSERRSERRLPVDKKHSAKKGAGREEDVIFALWTSIEDFRRRRRERMGWQV